MRDLVPYERYEGMPELFREMDKMFKRFWSGYPLQDWGEDFDLSRMPRLDISETDNALTIEAELPGLEKKDIDISLDRDQLVIKGEKKHEKEESGKKYHRVERAYGSFYRTIRLPGEVESDKIEASFKDGVLTITLPKTEESKRKISHVEIH